MCLTCLPFLKSMMFYNFISEPLILSPIVSDQLHLFRIFWSAQETIVQYIFSSSNRWFSTLLSAKLDLISYNFPNTISNFRFYAGGRWKISYMLFFYSTAHSHFTIFRHHFHVCSQLGSPFICVETELSDFLLPPANFKV